MTLFPLYYVVRAADAVTTGSWRGHLVILLDGIRAHHDHTAMSTASMTPAQLQRTIERPRLTATTSTRK